MAHTADPLSSTPLNSNPGDQSAANDVSRELLDQLASTFRPSWEPDQAPFGGPSDLSSGEIQALGSRGTAPEVRAESQSSIGPLAPPKPTDLVEPTESVIVQGSPAAAETFQPVLASPQAAEAPVPIGSVVGAPGTAGLPEDTVADVSPPFSHAAAMPPQPVSPFPLADDIAQGQAPAAPFPLAHDAEGVAYPAAPFPLRTAATAAWSEAAPSRSGALPPQAVVGDATARGSVRPGPFPEGSGRTPSVRPGMRTFDTAGAARRPWRPPLPSVDLDVPPFARRSRAPLWIGIGLAAAVLIGAGAWVMAGGSASPSATQSATPPAAETPTTPAPARTPMNRVPEPVVEAPSPPSSPQPNPLAAPPPAFPTAAAAEAPAPAPPAAAMPPSIPVTALPTAPRPAQHAVPAPAPRPLPHPKTGNPTIVRDVPF
ncbi:MAG TPA: hypothetical protein VEK07_04945 [Polyangiaceae bacterium]|nr:hypothetical protein [Polyangiaceae bacterium]